VSAPSAAKVGQARAAVERRGKIFQAEGNEIQISEEANSKPREEKSKDSLSGN